MFVIVCDSRKDSLPLALADRDKSTEWWTRNLNAIKVFNTEQGAAKVMARLRFNNPRIATLAWLKFKIGIGESHGND